MVANNYQQNIQDERIKTLESQMESTMHHIAITNEEMGSIKTDVAWLKQFFWIVVTSSIGALIAALFNLLLQVKA